MQKLSEVNVKLEEQHAEIKALARSLQKCEEERLCDKRAFNEKLTEIKQDNEMEFTRIYMKIEQMAFQLATFYEDLRRPSGSRSSGQSSWQQQSGSGQSGSKCLGKFKGNDQRGYRERHHEG
jgi:predicted  nucleic acid-binding Zn-ribbon protein